MNNPYQSPRAEIKDNKKPKNIPTSIKIIAGIFILEGCSSIIQIVTAEGFYLDLGVISIFVGKGLLNLNPKWRRFAIFLTVLGSIACFVAICLTVQSTNDLSLTYLSFSVHDISKPLVLSVYALLLSLSIWQFKVLKSSEILNLFENNEAESPAV